MPRPPAKLLTSDPRVDNYLETGEIGRRWAVNHRKRGSQAEPWTFGPATVIGENPEDTALRNSLCGVPDAFETERNCRKCGPLQPGDSPLCPTCGSPIVTVRRVSHRTEPVEYGPQVRWEKRDVAPDTGLVTAKHVRHGRWSEFQRECPDEATKATMNRLRVAGAAVPDKVFLLPPL